MSEDDMQDLDTDAYVSPRHPYSTSRRIDIGAEVLERHRLLSPTAGAKGDALRVLRTQLLLMMRRNGWRTLGVTSPNKGAGKTTISLNLAMGFAMELDHTALLVDADIRDPDLRDALELGPGPGLIDYLTGRALLEDLLIHPSIGNLLLLPGGAPVAHTSELMRSPVMLEMVKELRERYPDRLIVFDLPPALGGADTLAISDYMDATILLVEERRTTEDQLLEAYDLLSHSNVVGVVLNKSRELREPELSTRVKSGFFKRLARSRR